MTHTLMQIPVPYISACQPLVEKATSDSIWSLEASMYKILNARQSSDRSLKGVYNLFQMPLMDT